MSVYVDGLVQFGGPDSPKCFRNQPSCHMYADTLEELHSLAQRIGLKRAWFQDHWSLPHYDLVGSRRSAAVRLGAIEHDRYDMVNFSRQRRGQEPLPRPKWAKMSAHDAKGQSSDD
jgi:hypothetical protein